MGMNAHHTVASVSMENLVQRRMEATKDTRVCHPIITQCSMTNLISCYRKLDVALMAPA